MSMRGQTSLQKPEDEDEDDLGTIARKEPCPSNGASLGSNLSTSRRLAIVRDLFSGVVWTFRDFERVGDAKNITALPMAQGTKKV
jgi:hypothetical protein